MYSSSSQQHAHQHQLASSSLSPNNNPPPLSVNQQQQLSMQNVYHQQQHNSTVIASFSDASYNGNSIPTHNSNNSVLHNNNSVMNQFLTNNNNRHQQQSSSSQIQPHQQHHNFNNNNQTTMQQHNNNNNGSSLSSNSGSPNISGGTFNYMNQHNFVLNPTSSNHSPDNMYQQQFYQTQSLSNNNNINFQNSQQPIMMNRASHSDNGLDSNNQQWNQSNGGGIWNQLMNNNNNNQLVNNTQRNNYHQAPAMVQQHIPMENMNYNYVNNSNPPQNNALFSQLLNSNTSDQMDMKYSSASRVDEQDDNNDEPTETQFHPIACLNCRKIHKSSDLYFKSDKKLPSCTRCTTKGLGCEYKEPFFKKAAEKKEKKKRKKKGDVITMFNVGDENEMAANAIKSIKQNTIETYCSIVCMGNPPFDQEELEKLLLVGPQELLGRRDILSFLLSIQSLCELKFGYPDLAEETMIKARNILTHLFDDYGNPFVVSTYAHLAFFYAAEGKTKQARGYLSFVNHYITDWKQGHPSGESPHGEMNGQLYQFSLSRLNWLCLITELISTETHPVPNISTIEKLSLEMLGLAMPEEWKVYLTYYQLTDSKNVDERLKTLELFGSLLHFAMGPQNNSVFATRLHSLNNIICINGIRATVLLLSGCSIGALQGVDTSSDKVLAEHITLLEYAALAISKATEEEFFPFISPYLISFFLVAVKVNLEICKMIERGERENYRPCPKIVNRDCKLDGIDLDQYYTVVDYYSVVAKDLRGLHVLRKRYRYIAKYVTDLEEFLAKRSNQSLESIANFANSSIIPDLITPTPETNKSERIGTFYGEMRKFMLTFNKGLGEALLGQPRARGTNDNLFSHPALSMVMNGSIKPGNVNELSVYVTEISKNVKEQAEALRDLSTPSSIEDIELEFVSTLDPFQAHSSINQF